MTTGPLGERTTSAAARRLETILKSLPAELREPRRVVTPGPGGLGGEGGDGFGGEGKGVGHGAVGAEGDELTAGGGEQELSVKS